MSFLSKLLSRNLRSAKSRVGLNLQPYPSHCVPALCALTNGLPSVYVVLSSQFVSNVIDQDSSSFISVKRRLDNSSSVPPSGPRHESISVLQSPYHFYLAVAEQRSFLVYLYPQNPIPIVWPDTDQILSGLSNTKRLVHMKCLKRMVSYTKKTWMYKYISSCSQ